MSLTREKYGMPFPKKTGYRITQYSSIISSSFNVSNEVGLPNNKIFFPFLVFISRRVSAIGSEMIVVFSTFKLVMDLDKTIFSASLNQFEYFISLGVALG